MIWSAWGGTLSADQINDVIAHLRTLSPPDTNSNDADGKTAATSEDE